MPMTLNQIENEAFKLNNEEKLLLIQDVSASLTVSETEQRWYDEAENRLKALKQGSAIVYDGETVMNELKAKLTFRK